MTTDLCIYPFSAIVGQERLKKALLLNAVNPGVGGVLIRGEKGTAKSTAVRALAALLPAIRVVKNCPYSCDPDLPSDLCERCRAVDTSVPAVSRPVRLVNLPLNATEDRVVGGIDFGRAVAEGRRVVQTGLLAEANRGMVYVDEINLLDDHIVDTLLDASSSGCNVIEREGISFSHPSRFILIGTMNPEEGELRPQLRDRFGICVEVSAEQDTETRVLLMERREAFDQDPQSFIRNFASEERHLARQIANARAILSQLSLSREDRTRISQICLEKNTAGHRADLVMEQAARGLAALEGRTTISDGDILEAAQFALVHRKRDPSPPPDTDQNTTKPPPGRKEREDRKGKDEDPPKKQETERLPQPDRESTPEDHSGNDSREAGMEFVFGVGETFRVKPFNSQRDRIFRRGSGRRSRTRISGNQGRYVKSTLDPDTTDVALDATVRAAAPFQRCRRRENSLAVEIRPSDIRGRIREKRIGNFLLFLVDASGSMGARGRMAATKGAILSLLLDAYQKRDRVAMISFRRDGAHLNLPPTASIDLAHTLLKEMPVGGRTPLSAGLVKAHQVLRAFLTREPTARPIVILITDGRSNLALGKAKPTEESVLLASRLSTDERIRFLVVDTEAEGLISFGLARRLAAALDAGYYRIQDLKSNTLVDLVKGDL
ncbi:MAG: putative cobaltochelatase [Pseudomonadota bacterium]